VLVLCQYVLHSLLAFGPSHPVFGFCLTFLGLFSVAAYSGRDPVAPRATPADRRLSHRWAVVAQWYLIVYYAVRLAVYPFFSGELLLDDRLAGQQDNQIVFTLGLAVQPALAAFMYARMTSSRRSNWFDWATFAIVAVGLLGAGSKASVIPLVLVYLGVSSYLQRSISQQKAALIAIAAATLLAFYALSIFFPELEPEQILALVQNRLAANTDSLEYLSAIGVDPSAFPFSGPGALLPVIAKRFGFTMDYPPGVWLHGARFGDFSGYGPNAGIVMDYFGNLSWFGLLAAPLLGRYVRACRDQLTIVRCSFLSIAYIAVVDIGIFDIPAFVWGGMFVLIAASTAFVWRERRGKGSAPVTPFAKATDSVHPVS